MIAKTRVVIFDLKIVQAECAKLLTKNIFKAKNLFRTKKIPIQKKLFLIKPSGGLIVLVLFICKAYFKLGNNLRQAHFDL